jgi:hypothetical protein
MTASLNLFSAKYFSPFFQCFSIFASLLQPDRAEKIKQKSTIKMKISLLFEKKLIILLPS